MRERHWLQLSTDTGQDIDPDKDPDFTLQTAFDMELFKVRFGQWVELGVVDEFLLSLFVLLGRFCLFIFLEAIL